MGEVSSEKEILDGCCRFSRVIATTRIQGIGPFCWVKTTRLCARRRAAFWSARGSKCCLLLGDMKALAAHAG